MGPLLGSPSTTAPETRLSGTLCTFRTGSHTTQLSRHPLCPDMDSGHRARPVSTDSPCWLPACLPAWTWAAQERWPRRSPGSHQPCGTWGCWQAPWRYLGEENIYIYVRVLFLCFICWSDPTWKISFPKRERKQRKTEKNCQNPLVRAGWGTEAAPGQVRIPTSPERPSSLKASHLDTYQFCPMREILFSWWCSLLFFSPCTLWNFFWCYFHFSMKFRGIKKVRLGEF